MTNQNGAEATRHLELARTAIDDLDAEYATGRDRSAARIAHYHNVYRQNVKLAEVEALLYIGGLLAEMVPGQMPGIQGRPLSPEQLDRIEEMI